MSAPPDGTTAITDGFLTGFRCHQSGIVSGGTENVCQITKYPKCGTQSASRVQTKSVLGTWEALGGLTLGSTNVEGGLHSPFLVKTKLDRVTKNPSAYGQDAVKSVQNLWASSADLSWFPKPHSRWRPILDLNKPNLSETIRTSLQQVEWVTSIDFKDAYFHIPIQEQSRKYLRFHIQRSSIRFAHSTHGVHCDTKEVKLMAIHKGLRIHQYLGWLVRARSHQACLQHTQELVKMCQQLGWLVNLEKSELEPKQDFDL